MAPVGRVELTLVSTHSRPKAAAMGCLLGAGGSVVSTHSRPKAAAWRALSHQRNLRCFNTQPPEGGCIFTRLGVAGNHAVSTHSRPKAAAKYDIAGVAHRKVSTHSRPKAAAHLLVYIKSTDKAVSTHSRPKAAAVCPCRSNHSCTSFNTQPPEGGCKGAKKHRCRVEVSTHSRPKAAAS